MLNYRQKCVILINPVDSRNILSVEDWSNINAGAIQAYPPINLLYLASYLKTKRPDIKVIVKDYVGKSFGKRLLEPDCYKCKKIDSYLDVW